MKLSKSELIKLLSEHLGSDEDAVSSQLDKLVSDIQKSISKGDSFVIQGFGTFTSSSEGLHFEVSPAFAAEINYTYEGMLPIDVDGASAPGPDIEADSTSKPIIKKPVVIVDEGVDGEEDPFGLPEGDDEDLAFVDPIAFLDDLEGKPEEGKQGSEDSVYGDKIDEDFAESENEPYGAIGSIDDTVDEEEKQLLESGITLIDNSDDESEKNEESKSEDPFQAIVEADNETVESDEEPETVTGFALSDELEEIGLDEPPKVVEDNSSNVLDEFFDPVPDPKIELEGVLHDSNDEIESLLNDGEEPVQDLNGPRIVSIEEDEKDYSISLGSILKWVAIVIVVVLIAGGAYWYLTGPGKSLFETSEPSIAQAVVTQPMLNESTPPLGDEVLTSDENQSEIDSEPSNSVVTEESNTAESIVPEEMDESMSTSQSTDVAQNPTNNATAELSAVSEPDDEEELQNQVVSDGSNVNFGLGGEVQSISGRVYSIIIHSLPSQVSAQEQCNEISSLNLRCLVREATGPQGRTTYRVGVGQFDSIESAEAAVAQLPEPFRSRNFVARVN